MSEESNNKYFYPFQGCSSKLLLLFDHQREKALVLLIVLVFIEVGFHLQVIFLHKIVTSSRSLVFSPAFCSAEFWTEETLTGEIHSKAKRKI